MMKVFLAAGVAALAISAPVAAGQSDHGKGHGAKAGHSGQAKMNARANARAEVRAERRSDNRAEARATARANARAEARAENRAERRREFRQEARQNQMERRQEFRREVRENRMERARDNAQFRRDVRENRMERMEANGYGVGGCPPGLAKKNPACMPPGQFRKSETAMFRAENRAMLRAARIDDLNRRYNMQMAAPIAAASLLGVPLAKATGIIPLNEVPRSLSYLYPDNRDYYYRYGDGYLYQVNRSDNLIDSLIPLLAGGYLPGTVLPQTYMSSNIPTNYGWNSFYPSNSNNCTRYANGVVYYVDCGSGMIENIVPVYNNGYGVGQMLPSSYGYYNVPSQYRPYYSDNSDYGYWYAPGAIYQYDTESNLITSVAALLGQGLSVGQPLPSGYSAYNVPMGYRDTYYDTPQNWYRYSNGYVYQVDPVTQLVTAVVASALS